MDSIDQDPDPDPVSPPGAGMDAQRHVLQVSGRVPIRSSGNFYRNAFYFPSFYFNKLLLGENVNVMFIELIILAFMVFFRN